MCGPLSAYQTAIQGWNVSRRRKKYATVYYRADAPKLSQDELQTIGKKVVAVAEGMPGVTWIKSHISESAGKSYCEFEAPNPEVLRQHSQQVGIPYDSITAVEIEVDPGMFR